MSSYKSPSKPTIHGTVRDALINTHQTLLPEITKKIYNGHVELFHQHPIVLINSEVPDYLIDWYKTNVLYATPASLLAPISSISTPSSSPCSKNLKPASRKGKPTTTIEQVVEVDKQIGKNKSGANKGDYDHSKSTSNQSTKSSEKSKGKKIVSLGKTNKSISIDDLSTVEALCKKNLIYEVIDFDNPRPGTSKQYQFIDEPIKVRDDIKKQSPNTKILTNKTLIADNISMSKSPCKKQSTEDLSPRDDTHLFKIPFRKEPIQKPVRVIEKSVSRIEITSPKEKSTQKLIKVTDKSVPKLKITMLKEKATPGSIKSDEFTKIKSPTKMRSPIKSPEINDENKSEMELIDELVEIDIPDKPSSVWNTIEDENNLLDFEDC